MQTTLTTRTPLLEAFAPPKGRNKRLGGLKILAGSVAALAAGVAASLGIGRYIFDRQLSAEVENLYAASNAAGPPVLTEASLAGLPEPVQRWLRASGVVGRERPSTIRLRYDGDFRLGEDKGWLPYTSQTYYTTNPPAFLWTVEMRMFNVVPIVGRDRYRDGEGSIRMKVLSLVPVADKAGGGLNQGSLLRYLGETIWFPAGAVAPYIEWQSRDPDSAVATMTYGGVTASLTFVFDAEGRVIRQEAADRYNDGRGRAERWSVPITDWARFNGVQVPSEGTALWHYDTGEYTYIRWHVTDVQYGVPERYERRVLTVYSATANHGVQ